MVAQTTLPAELCIWDIFELWPHFVKGGAGAAPTAVSPPLTEPLLVYGAAWPPGAHVGLTLVVLFLLNDGALLNLSCFISGISGYPHEEGQQRSDGPTSCQASMVRPPVFSQAQHQASSCYGREDAWQLPQ